jgi:putative membrane protein (TIGR04086 family)
MKNNMLIKNLLISLVVSIAVVFVVLALSSIILLKTNMNDALVNVLNLISFSIGAFAGGLTISKLFKEKGLVYGLINGLVLFSISFIISLVINFSAPSLFSLIKLIAISFFSLVGGVIGVNTKKKRSI